MSASLTPFRAAFLVSERRTDGRFLGRVIQGTPMWPSEPSLGAQEPTDLDDVMGLGSQSSARLTVSTYTVLMPTSESPEWEVDRSRTRPFELFGKPSSPPPALPDLAEGDVLVAQACLGRPDDDGAADADTVKLYGAHIIGRGLTEECAVAEVEAALDPDNSRFISLRGEETIWHEANAVRASREPNEALVVVWRGDALSSGLEAVRIGGTGGWFYHCDSSDARENGIEIGDEPGVFFFSDGRPWSSGDGIWDEYDSGINGTLEPATLEHLARLGFTLDGLREEISDVMEDILEPGQDPFALLAEQGAELPFLTGHQDAMSPQVR